MALKAVLSAAEFDKLGDALKSEYKKGEGGKYVLDVAEVDGYGLDHISPLKNALERAKGDRAALAERIAAIEDLEKDPKTAREAMAKWKEIANWTPDEKIKAQIAEHVRQVKEKYDGELTASGKQVEKLRAVVDKALRKSAAEAAIVAKGGKPKLLLSTVLDHLKLEEKDGDFRVSVVGPDGTPRITRKKTTDGTPVDAPMALDELVETLKNDPEFAPAFAGSGPGGAGTPPPGAAGATSGYRISRADAQDPAKYRAAKAEAAKAGKAVEIVE